MLDVSKKTEEVSEVINYFKSLDEPLKNHALIMLRTLSSVQKSGILEDAKTKKATH